MYWSIRKQRLASNKMPVRVPSIGHYVKARCYMTQRIECAQRLLTLAERDMTSFRALTSYPEVDIRQQVFSPNKLLKNALKP